MDQKYLIGYIGSTNIILAAQLTSPLTPWSASPKYRTDSVMRCFAQGGTANKVLAPEQQHH